MSSLALLFVVLGFAFLRSKIHLAAGHHPEWRGCDALDRLFHWCLVVAVVWVLVAVAVPYLHVAQVLEAIEPVSIGGDPDK